MKPFDPNQYIWDNFHSLPQNSFFKDAGKYGMASNMGPSQQEFINMLRHYNLNTNDLDKLPEQIKKIIEIQRRSAWDRSPGATDEWSNKANALENYMNFIFKGMQFPNGGSSSLPYDKKQ